MAGLPHRTGDREDSRQGAGTDHLHIYNRKRVHSSIGYRTPAKALNDYRTAAQAA
jgi:transposase InsO family protein